jgi:hypothetical protein
MATMALIDSASECRFNATVPVPTSQIGIAHLALSTSLPFPRPKQVSQSDTRFPPISSPSATFLR